ncbi:MAG: CatB-related O-acetyltransferase [Methanothermobacter sp.]
MNLSEMFKKYQKQQNKKKNITIGEFTYGQPTVHMWTDKYKVKIGKFCSFSYNNTIIVDGNHRIDWVSTYPFGKLIKDIPENPGHPIGKGDIIIGNDVWMGQNALILPGVNIGDGAVIGANSVVTRNVDDYEIVAGNPAKHVKYRFNPQQIDSLKKIRWWDWPIEKIKENINFIESSDIDEFIEKFS